MRLLARYLLRECLIALVFCFSAFLLLWITLDLLSELHDLQENKMHAWDIVQYYFFKVPAPDFLPVALPVALLLALLYALTTHARHNEITAIRAAGVSLWRLCLPYFMVGLAATVLLFLSNEFCAPRAGELAEQVLTRRVQKNRSPEQQQQRSNVAFNNAREGRFWRIASYNLKTGEMTQPFVRWKLSDGLWQNIFADRAIRTNGVWTFFNEREYQGTQETNSLPLKLAPNGIKPIPEFTETPDMIRSEIRINDQRDHPTRTHRADVPIDEIINYLGLHPDPDSNMRPWIYTKFHGRFAGPCACFVVVLLGVPFALVSGRRNAYVGVATSLFIFFIYVAFQQIGFIIGERGLVPAWLGAWLPNLLFGITGLCLMARVR